MGVRAKAHFMRLLSFISPIACRPPAAALPLAHPSITLPPPPPGRVRRPGRRKIDMHMDVPHPTTAPGPRASLSFALCLLPLALLAGCKTGPELVKDAKTIDRALVDYPPGFELRPYVRGLTAPCAIAFDPTDDSLLIAESGVDDTEPRIFGFKKDGTY